MKAYLLTVGDEILVGQITDTNSVYMARQLNAFGIDVVEKISVGDTVEGIRAALDRALGVAELVLMTGGLGPTKDDITKKVLADYFGTELKFHEESWERLQRVFERFGRPTTEAHRQQCLLPAAARVLTNKMGTAPGIWLERGGRIVVAMPGVPYEMQYLVDNEVLPRVAERLSGPTILHRTLLTAGAGETDIADRIADLEDALPQYVRLAYLPNLGTVRLRLTGRHEDAAALARELDAWRERLRERLQDLIYGEEEDSLPAAVGRLLRERGLRCATVESCTGGYLAHLITSIPGSSDYFEGALVTYSNGWKENLVGVQAATLEAHGAVSEATVREMVQGAVERLGIDVAVATSGIAGPGGGTPDKPVGTVWLAVGNRDFVETRLIRAGKDRLKNIEYGANQALNLLRLFVAKHYPASAVQPKEGLPIR